MYHGIASSDENGNDNDCISINSYNQITCRLDTNNNQGASYFRILRDTTAASNEGFRSGYDGTRWTTYIDGKVGIATGPDASYALKVNGHTYIANNTTIGGDVSVGGHFTIDGVNHPVLAIKGDSGGNDAHLQLLKENGHGWTIYNSGTTLYFRSDTSSNDQVLSLASDKTATFAGTITQSKDSASGVVNTFRNTNHGGGAYSELHIENSDQSLVVGYSDNYSSGEWDGGWVYPTDVKI